MKKKYSAEIYLELEEEDEQGVIDFLEEVFPSIWQHASLSIVEKDN